VRLDGARAIRDYLGWNESKFKKHLPSMRAAGVVLYEMRGRPAQRRMWSMTELITLWLIKAGQEGKVF